MDATGELTLMWKQVFKVHSPFVMSTSERVHLSCNPISALKSYKKLNKLTFLAVATPFSQSNPNVMKERVYFIHINLSALSHDTTETSFCVNAFRKSVVIIFRGCRSLRT